MDSDQLLRIELPNYNVSQVILLKLFFLLQYFQQTKITGRHFKLLIVSGEVLNKNCRPAALEGTPIRMISFRAAKLARNLESNASAPMRDACGERSWPRIARKNTNENATSGRGFVLANRFSRPAPQPQNSLNSRGVALSRQCARSAS